MIVARTPLRVSFFGGGSDLAAYYKRQQGFCLSTTIDQYMYVAVCETSTPGIKLMYSEIEQVPRVSDLKHDRVRESLKFMKISSNFEIASFSQIPTKGTGLGSSSTFTVGLLNALHAHQELSISKSEMAKKACHVEINLCEESIGKQDQYAAAYGGFNTFEFNEDESVDVKPLTVDSKTIESLNRELLLFYTGIRRDAADILSTQSNNTRDNTHTFSSISDMVDIGRYALKNLKKGDIDGFGYLLNDAWELKRNMSEGVTTPRIDECYEAAIKAGALGGKVLGAGGGGFMLFYVPSAYQWNVITTLGKMGLEEFPFKFSEGGSEILCNR